MIVCSLLILWEVKPINVNETTPELYWNSFTCLKDKDIFNNVSASSIVITSDSIANVGLSDDTCSVDEVVSAAPVEEVVSATSLLFAVSLEVSSLVVVVSVEVSSKVSSLDVSSLVVVVSV